MFNNIKYLFSSNIVRSSLSTQIAVSAVVGGGYLIYNKNSAPSTCDGKWPTITRAEVAKHKKMEDGIWFTFRDGVYDITKFQGGHPGGPVALSQVAGGSVEQMWTIYRFHLEKRVQNIIAKYKIGELPHHEVLDYNDEMIPWTRQNIPTRTAMTTLVQTFPYCCETNPKLLVRHFITPLREGYVRSHNRVPIYESEDEHTVDLFMEDTKIKTLTIKELKALPQHEVMVCMRCAGHRRTEMDDLMPSAIRGVNFGPYAIYNCTYSGPRITDVLKYCGVDISKLKGKWLVTSGADEDFPGDPIKTSAPFDRILDPIWETIMAVQANGEDIPEDHGFPVRMMYPGFVGIRSTKWVKKMEIRNEETKARYQYRVYKPVQAKRWEDVDFDSIKAPLGHCLQCVIAEPERGSTVVVKPDDKFITIKGVAVGEGGSGARVVKVKCSSDEGENWLSARITRREEKDPRRKCFSWVHWECDMPIKPATQKAERMRVLAKAYDSAGHTMDAPVEEVFNLAGTLVNPPHPVEFKYRLEFEPFIEKHKKKA